MKRYIRSSIYSESEKLQRRIVRSIAEEVLREHGENNSIGTYDRFLRAMMDRWGTISGHDREFLHAVITKAFEKEFMK